MTLRRRRPRHRRQSSVGISWNRFQERRRRSSFTSWARDNDYVVDGDEATARDADVDDEDENDDDVEGISGRTALSRPYSWGPVGEFYRQQSMCFSEIDRSLLSHQECKWTNELIYNKYSKYVWCSKYLTIRNQCFPQNFREIFF